MPDPPDRRIEAAEKNGERVKLTAIISMACAVPALLGSMIAPAIDGGDGQVTTAQVFEAAPRASIPQVSDGPSNHTETDARTEPFSLSPSHHINCMVYNFPRHTIKSFTFKKQDTFRGKVKMLCGSDTGSGYRHINYRHKSQWTKKMNFHSGQNQANWDTFMFKATQHTLDHPVSVRAQKGSKLAFGGRVNQKKIVRGKVVQQTTWDTCVIVSKNNKIIITSFPGKCP